MSRLLYFDCFSGISGDMTLGALLDAGLPLDGLKAALGSLALGDVEIRTEKVLRAGVSATKFIVDDHAASIDPRHHPHRHLPKIFTMIDTVRYGAGERDKPSTPNVLRVFIGQEASATVGHRVTVIACEIDDMNPQIFGVAMDRLYAAVALEVFYVLVQMKKNRPGTLLTVVARPETRRTLADIIFRETTTIGLRYSEVERECLQREIVSVE